MKIGQLVHNLYPVSPDSGQAIYSTVGWLTDGLVDRGNDVNLYAAGNSVTKAKLTAVTKDDLHSHHMKESDIRNYYHLLASTCYQDASNLDLIHSHFSLISSFYASLVNIPTVLSLHNPITPDSIAFLKAFKDLYYISFSLAQRKQIPGLNWAANIYHGIDTQQFQFNPIPKDYLLYIGRITEDKGVHLAIEAALAAKVPLIIAGPSYPEEKYWQTHIQKWIDGENVRYVGTINFETKIKYYQNARALLFPTQRSEPFGMVMIEAMACGTPVIGWNNGSVPEVVQDKQTGYVVDSMKDMVKAIKAIDKISREDTRKRAVDLFSVEKMVTGYERVYLRIIEDYRKKRAKRS